MSTLVVFGRTYAPRSVSYQRNYWLLSLGRCVKNGYLVGTPYRTWTAPVGRFALAFGFRETRLLMTKNGRSTEISMDSPGVDANVKRAHEAAVAGDWISAEAILRRVLGTAPDHLLALDLLGYVLFFQDRPLEAEVACRRALEQDPTRAYSMKGLGLCLAKQGQTERAISVLKDAISLSPGWLDPKWDLAYVLANVGRLDEAIDVLEESLLSVPEAHERIASAILELRARKLECS